MTKAFWKSRTLLFNLLSAVVAAAPVVVTMVQDMQVLGLDPELAARLLAGLSIVNVVGNMYLRTITTQGVSLK